ncbi:MAG: AsnC family transcriptional regulator [Candidatus Aenigmarchaeota archaeon]|nr:AsnC family transcriptional regulator [Candidatus Aenigmarchaeota archaeon]
MTYKLDLRDKRIIYELDTNSRKSLSDISKKLGMSKQVVAYRVQRLLDNNIIQKFLMVIDVAKLGYTPYKILLRLRNVNREKESEIVEFLRNHPFVEWLSSTDGNFDMNFNILAESALHLYNQLKDLEARFGDYIAEMDTNVMVLASFYPRDYMIQEKRQQRVFKAENPVTFGSKPETFLLDETDKSILSILASDARTTTTEISEKLKISRNTVKSRIKQMEKSNVIQGYTIVLNNEKLEQMHYKILITLHHLSKERAESLDWFIARHPNIWFSNKSIGNFDIEANIEVKNAAQFREIILEFKEKFSDIITNYNVLQMYRINKFHFYPMAKIEHRNNDQPFNY